MEKGYLHNYVHIGFGKFDMESRIDEYYPKGRILPESQEASLAAMPLKEFKKYFNIKNKRVGPLLQGEFKSVYIESNEQLIHLSRYIHLNPVVANLAEEPKDYIWSSYPSYLEIKEEKKHPHPPRKRPEPKPPFERFTLLYFPANLYKCSSDNL